MFRSVLGSSFVLMLLLAGCAKEEDYLDVFRAQRANWHELADILESIKDDKSMTEAKTVLEDRLKKYEAISRRASSLPKPPPPEVLQALERDRFVTEGALSRLKAESKRVSELPGGMAFLKQFESSKGLLSAVQKMMKRCLLSMILIATAAGCTDTVDSLAREYRNAINEAIDALETVTTDEQAQRVRVRVLQNLDIRFKEIDARFDIVNTNRTKAEMVKEVFESDSLQLYLTDLEINRQRYSLELTRLRNVYKQYIDRERELQLARGRAPGEINGRDVCPNLDALLFVDLKIDRVGTQTANGLEIQLVSPKLFLVMSQFPAWAEAKKVDNYDKLYGAFKAKRKSFTSSNVHLVE